MADPNVVSKPFSLWLVMDERNFTLALNSQEEVNEWMDTINVLARLHNGRNDFKDKTGFADMYKHVLITACKKALNQTVKLTGFVFSFS